MASTERVLQTAQELGILRPRDLAARGIPRQYLYRALERGLLRRVGRGLYVLPDHEPTEHHTLAEASKRVPRGVVCLLSALRFHGLTTQAPFEAWMAVGVKDRLPAVDWPPVRFVRFSKQALTAGIEAHEVERVSVRVYSPAKTVADCFKYRRKIGLDVALEALRDCLQQGKCDSAELWHYAEICRVTNVMRPYWEALS